MRFDAESSTWMFVGIHSTVLGPGFGGTRMKVYAAPDDALGDVLRLSAAMTFKNAMADLRSGEGSPRWPSRRSPRATRAIRCCAATRTSWRRSAGAT